MTYKTFEKTMIITLISSISLSALFTIPKFESLTILFSSLSILSILIWNKHYKIHTELSIWKNKWIADSSLFSLYSNSQSLNSTLLKWSTINKSSSSLFSSLSNLSLSQEHSLYLSITKQNLLFTQSPQSTNLNTLISHLRKF
jgi:hypothetical protein